MRGRVEASAPVKEEQLDHEHAGDRIPADLADEFEARLHGPARGKQVVDHQHALSRRHGVGVHLDGVGPVLELIGLRGRLRGQLARLADGDEPLPEGVGEGGAEDEAPGLDAADHVVGRGSHQARESVDGGLQSLRALEQRRDVLEQDARLGEVRDVADESFDHGMAPRRGPPREIAARRRLRRAEGST